MDHINKCMFSFCCEKKTKQLLFLNVSWSVCVVAMETLPYLIRELNSAGVSIFCTETFLEKPKGNYKHNCFWD